MNSRSDTDPALRALEPTTEAGRQARLDDTADLDVILAIEAEARVGWMPEEDCISSGFAAAAEAAPLDVVSGDPSPKLRHVLECVDEYTRGWRDALAEHGRSEAAPLDVERLARAMAGHIWHVVDAPDLARKYAALRSPDTETTNSGVSVRPSGSIPSDRERPIRTTAETNGDPDTETAGAYEARTVPVDVVIPDTMTAHPDTETAGEAG